MSSALEAKGLIKRFDGLLAADRVDMTIADGEVHAVIGPNGAGKTTLISLLSGELRPDAGTIRLRGDDITRLRIDQRCARGLTRSYQITSIFSELTVLDNVALAVQARSGHSFRFFRPARRQTELRDPAYEILAQVGLAGRAEIVAGNLAHGEKRALEIAIALAARPYVLMLDEPMAGMGPQDSARMVELLSTLKGRYTILLVEHDMDAVFTLADRVTVLVYGRPIASGSCDAIRNDDEVRRAYLGEKEEVV
jgi:branched-chain amino acid transport system ATP-binding protein